MKELTGYQKRVLKYNKEKAEIIIKEYMKKIKEVIKMYKTSNYKITATIELSNMAYTWIESKQIKVNAINKHEAIETAKRIIKRLYNEFSINFIEINAEKGDTRVLI